MDVGLVTAFFAGLASFISPCVLPLAPPYLAYIGGTTLDQIDVDHSERDPKVAMRVVAAAFCFVLGLGTVFTLLGLAASVGGGLLLEYKHWLSLGSGALIYAFGLHFWGLRRSIAVFAVVAALFALTVFVDTAIEAEEAGLASGWAGLVDWAGDMATPIAVLAVVSVIFQALGHLWRADHIPLLHREVRFSGPQKAGSLGASFLIGMAFAFGWTPCIGPILGSILAIAGQQGSLVSGTLLLAVYALGLGVPFLVAAIFMRPFLIWARGFRRHMAKVEAGMGIVLIVMGAMMATGTFERLAFWLLDTFPALAEVG